MQVPRDLSRRMLEAVEDVPIVDIYERLLPESKRVSQPVDFVAWLAAFLETEYRALGLGADELALLADVQAAPDERWALVSRHWPFIRTTGSGRTVLRVAWKFFGVEAVDERTWKDISAQLWKMQVQGFYCQLLRERANVRMTLVDNPIDPSMRPCCATIGNYDWLLQFCCGADLDRALQELKLKAVLTLDLLDALVEKAIQRDLETGRVAFKLEALPDPARPSSEEVTWALSRVARHGEEEAHEGTCEPVLQSYLVDRFLTRAPRSRRPVLVRVDDAVTVERLRILAGRHKEVRFVGVYAGGVDAFSLLALGRTLPNVTLAIGDLWRTAPQLARQSLVGWLHGVPLNKVFAVSGGTTMVEAACVQAWIVREQMAAALSEMVAWGQLDEDDAHLAMERLLFKNAWEYFGLA
jgi:hypothetical protein